MFNAFTESKRLYVERLKAGTIESPTEIDEVHRKVMMVTGDPLPYGIDPNLIVDADGVPWLSFGSFWSGIKMRRLDAETGKLSAEDDNLYSIARRPDFVQLALLIATILPRAPLVMRRPVPGEATPILAAFADANP